MTGEQFRACAEHVAMRGERPYTHATVHPEDMMGLMESWSMGVTVLESGRWVQQLYGYQLGTSDAVWRGTVLFHSPDCAGTYRVAA